MKHRRLIIVALLGFVGFISGGWFFQGSDSQANNARQRARIFESVLKYVSEYYVDTLDAAQLYDMAIDGMLDQLQDPYTSFLQQTGFEELSISTTGNYGGVGLRIGLAGRMDPGGGSDRGLAGRAGRLGVGRSDY